MTYDDAQAPATPRLPLRLEPMMLMHVALTGDTAQRRAWRERIDTIRHLEALDGAGDSSARDLLKQRRVWRRVRFAGKLGATFNLGLGAAWMALLIPYYAVTLGFGWPAALMYLLPVPIAFRASRRAFERGALSAQARLGRWPTLGSRLAALSRGTLSSIVGGFVFGFTLLFLQGLISWFMTPLPTLGAELFYDLLDALWAGAISGAMSSVLAPVLGLEAPRSAPQLRG